MARMSTSGCGAHELVPCPGRERRARERRRQPPINAAPDALGYDLERAAPEAGRLIMATHAGTLTLIMYLSAAL